MTVKLCGIFWNHLHLQVIIKISLNFGTAKFKIENHLPDLIALVLHSTVYGGNHCFGLKVWFTCIWYT